MKLNQCLMAAILYTVCITVAHAQGISDLVVYIECTQEGKPVSRGSGVLVSERGHVLTAGHVVPEGYTCRGVQGNPTHSTRALIKDPRSMQGIDAAMLRFIPSEGEKFPSAKFCKLDETLKGKSIKARGFHQKSHELSVRQGVISTIHPNEKGIFETDGLTADGMSGGPVMLGDGPNLIGIIAGAQFDIGTAQPIYFGALAVEVIANTFQLDMVSSPCLQEDTDDSINKAGFTVNITNVTFRKISDEVFRAYVTVNLQSDVIDNNHITSLIYGLVMIHDEEKITSSGRPKSLDKECAQIPSCLGVTNQIASEDDPILIRGGLEPDEPELLTIDFKASAELKFVRVYIEYWQKETDRGGYCTRDTSKKSPETGVPYLKEQSKNGETYDSPKCYYSHDRKIVDFLSEGGS